jgi:hypothetical protein
MTQFVHQKMMNWMDTIVYRRLLENKLITTIGEITYARTYLNNILHKAI